MSQIPLNDDLNVIANSDLSITLLNGDLNIIQKLDDEPNDVGGLTSDELKAKFDESGLTIQKYINETLVPELLAEQAVEAARISAENQRIANENARVAAEQNRVHTNTGIVAQATAQANEAKRQADRAEAAASGGNHASRHAKTGPDPITPVAIGAAPATESSEHPGCYYRMVNGVQEWINPPLMLDTEYRTTKRYNGTVVYQKFVYSPLIKDLGAGLEYELFFNPNVRVFSIHSSVGAHPSPSFPMFPLPFSDNYGGTRSVSVEYFMNEDESMGNKGSYWGRVTNNNYGDNYHIFSILEYYYKNT